MKGRNETEAERLDRNWIELIQELRVAQTGVQVLAGFLLTLPFSQRFESIGAGYHKVFLVGFTLAVITVGLMTTPVSLHRFLFARQEKDTLVRIGSLLAKLGMASMGLTLATVVVLIFGVVVGNTAAVVAGVLVVVFYALAWIGLPMYLLREDRQQERDQSQ